MGFQLTRGHPTVALTVAVIFLKTLQVETLSWGDLRTETVTSLDVYTYPTIRDVGFSKSDYNKLRLTWTLDKGNEAVLGISVELSVKRLSGIAVEWYSLPALTFVHPVTLVAGSALKYSRELISAPGEAYRATVTLLTQVSNTSTTVEDSLLPFGPASVYLASLTESSVLASVNLRSGRADAYSGNFMKADDSTEGYFGPTNFAVPLLTETTLSITINLTFKLTRGETYNLVLQTLSWGGRSGVVTRSNSKTIAPSTPVIDEIKLVTPTSLRLEWRLPLGIADTFLVTLSGKKTVMNEDSSRVAEGRYSATFPYVNTQTRYDFTVTAESNNVQGEPSETVTYDKSQGGDFSTENVLNKTTSETTQSPAADETGNNSDVIVPWVVCGVLAVIVLVLAGILALTVKKCRQFQKESTRPSEAQSDYETIRSSYLHPIHVRA